MTSDGSVRAVVVGHVEWIRFARVAHVPGPGDIAHTSDSWEGAGGAGAVAAVQLARLAGHATLFTAFGDDDVAARARHDLERQGVTVHAARRDGPTRTALTMIDDAGERTIVTLGERLAPCGSDPLPWNELRETDVVFLTAGDEAAVRLARGARTLVATSRILDLLAAADVPLDAVVGSLHDPAERYDAELLATPPGLVVLTEGVLGGTWLRPGEAPARYRAVPAPGPVVDTYGAGDSFQAGLAFGLGAGLDVDEALALAARCGAHAVTGRGPTGGQLDAEAAGITPGTRRPPRR
jgi:ribokinase